MRGHDAVDQPQQADNGLEHQTEVCKGCPESSIQNCFGDKASLVVTFCPLFTPLLTDNSFLSSTLAAQQSAYSNVSTVKPCVTWLEEKVLGMRLEESAGEVVIGENCNDPFADRDWSRDVGKLTYFLQGQIKGMSGAMQCK